MGTYICESVF